MPPGADKEPASPDFAKLLLDLPAAALSPITVKGWAKALNQRNFQDKLLRIIQYGGRGVAFYLAQADPKDSRAKTLTTLYKQVSLSRKAFRCCQSIAHAHTASEHLKALLKDTSDEKAAVKAFSFMQWATFSVFIFWDNMCFLTNKSVGVIDLPKSLWFNPEVARQTMINWRARSDLFAFCAGLSDFLLARRKLASLKKKLPLLVAGEDGAALAAAEAKARETRYPVVKYFSDIVTYLPQASWSTAFPLHNTKGWHDGYIGAFGVIAALISCRAEWIKLK